MRKYPHIHESKHGLVGYDAARGDKWRVYKRASGAYAAKRIADGYDKYCGRSLTDVEHMLSNIDVEYNTPSYGDNGKAKLGVLRKQHSERFNGGWRAHYAADGADGSTWDIVASCYKIDMKERHGNRIKWCVSIEACNAFLLSLT